MEPLAAETFLFAVVLFVGGLFLRYIITLCRFYPVDPIQSEFIETPKTQIPKRKRKHRRLFYSRRLRKNQKAFIESDSNSTISVVNNENTNAPVFQSIPTTEKFLPIAYFPTTYVIDTNILIHNFEELCEIIKTRVVDHFLLTIQVFNEFTVYKQRDDWRVERITNLLLDHRNVKIQSKRDHFDFARQVLKNSIYDHHVGDMIILKACLEIKKTAKVTLITHDQYFTQVAVFAGVATAKVSNLQTIKTYV